MQITRLAIWVSSLLAWQVKAALVTRTLVVTNEPGAPDGHVRNLIKVNGQFPGPPLIFDEDDDVEITVVNRKATNTTIHFHGMLQQGTPWSDGVPGLTQKPIEPGESFVHKFKATPPGTYFYHAHVRAELMDGLYGALFIKRKPGALKPWNLISNFSKDIQQMDCAADNPHFLVISDWEKYNSSEYLGAEAAMGLQTFCVDSVLVNGKGSVRCPGQQAINEMTIPIMRLALGNETLTDKGCLPFVAASEGKWIATGHPERAPPGLQQGCVPSNGSQEIIKVDSSKSKWTSLNFIGAHSLKALRIAIDEHQMYVYEVDGQYIYPRKVEDVDLWAAERFSVMVKLDKPSKDYVIRIPDSGMTQLISGYATLRYVNNPDLGPSIPYLSYSGVNMTDNLTVLNKADMPPYPPIAPAPKADKLYLLRLARWNAIWQFSLSGTAMYPMDWHAYAPFLYYPDSPDAMNESLVIRTNYGEWIDLVFEWGSFADWPIDFSHVMHKHGTKMWQIGYSLGSWNWTTTEEAIAAYPEAFNLVDPPYRDTVVMGSLQPESWIVVRYQVTNPGPWLVHCHFDTHLAEGMAMVLMDGVDRWPVIPPEYALGRNGINGYY